MISASSRSTDTGSLCRHFLLLIGEHFLDGEVAVDLDRVTATVCLCIADHCFGQVAGFDCKPSARNPIKGRSYKPKRVLERARLFSIAKQEPGLEDGKPRKVEDLRRRQPVRRCGYLDRLLDLALDLRVQKAGLGIGALGSDKPKVLAADRLCNLGAPHHQVVVDPSKLDSRSGIGPCCSNCAERMAKSVLLIAYVQSFRKWLSSSILSKSRRTFTFYQEGKQGVRACGGGGPAAGVGSEKQP